jgi:hypothetical protein
VTGSGDPGTYSLSDFKLAFGVQYPIWAIGLIGVVRSRRRLRATRGLQLEPLYRAALRHWRGT